MDKKAAIPNNKFEKMTPIHYFNNNNNSPLKLRQKQQQLLLNNQQQRKNNIGIVGPLRVVINPHSTVLNSPIKRHYNQHYKVLEASKFLPNKMHHSFVGKFLFFNSKN